MLHVGDKELLNASLKAFLHIFGQECVHVIDDQTIILIPQSTEQLVWFMVNNQAINRVKIIWNDEALKSNHQNQSDIVIVLLDMTRMNKVTEIHVEDRLVRVQAGCSLATLQNTLFEHGLYFPIHPCLIRSPTDSWGSNQNSSILIGQLCCNQTLIPSPRSIRFGSFLDQTIEMLVITPDGRQVNTSLCSSLSNRSSFSLLEQIFASLSVGVLVELVLRVQVIRPTLILHTPNPCNMRFVFKYLLSEQSIHRTLLSCHYQDKTFWIEVDESDEPRFTMQSAPLLKSCTHIPCASKNSLAILVSVRMPWLANLCDLIKIIEDKQLGIVQGRMLDGTFYVIVEQSIIDEFCCLLDQFKAYYYIHKSGDGIPLGKTPTEGDKVLETVKRALDPHNLLSEE